MEDRSNECSKKLRTILLGGGGRLDSIGWNRSKSNYVRDKIEVMKSYWNKKIKKKTCEIPRFFFYRLKITIINTLIREHRGLSINGFSTSIKRVIDYSCSIPDQYNPEINAPLFTPGESNWDCRREALTLVNYCNRFSLPLVPYLTCTFNVKTLGTVHPKYGYPGIFHPSGN